MHKRYWCANVVSVVQLRKFNETWDPWKKKREEKYFTKKQDANIFQPCQLMFTPLDTDLFEKIFAHGTDLTCFTEMLELFLLLQLILTILE